MLHTYINGHERWKLTHHKGGGATTVVQKVSAPAPAPPTAGDAAKNVEKAYQMGRPRRAVGRSSTIHASNGFYDQMKTLLGQ